MLVSSVRCSVSFLLLGMRGELVRCDCRGIRPFVVDVPNDCKDRFPVV